MSQSETSNEIRKLNITDTERIERFRRAGYGGSVSDALYMLGVRTQSSQPSSSPCARACSSSGGRCRSSCTRRWT